MILAPITNAKRQRGRAWNSALASASGQYSRRMQQIPGALIIRSRAGKIRPILRSSLTRLSWILAIKHPIRQERPARQWNQQAVPAEVHSAHEPWLPAANTWCGRRSLSSGSAWARASRLPAGDNSAADRPAGTEKLDGQAI